MHTENRFPIAQGFLGPEGWERQGPNFEHRTDTGAETVAQR